MAHVLVAQIYGLISRHIDTKPRIQSRFVFYSRHLVDKISHVFVRNEWYINALHCYIHNM